MLQISGIDHLNLNIVNLDKSIEFYNKVLGFEIKEEGTSPSGSPYAIIGSSERAYLCLYQNLESPLSEDRDKRYLNHLGFNITNFDDVKKSLKELGVNIDLEYGYENSRSIYITDPNGLEIELSEKFGGGLH
ncbi:MAG: VOC family protein [Halobacteriovoraceae bacterium]|nr:VOC family protein [Halobacteriovoraceae bacterium]MBT5092779.1 VOC family protein [Halobacteriovoraceae bacterium]